MQWNPNQILSPLIHPPVWRMLVTKRVRFNKIRSKHLHQMLDNQISIGYNQHFHTHTNHPYYHYIAFLGSTRAIAGHPVATYLLVYLDNRGNSHMSIYLVWSMSQTCINSITFHYATQTIQQVIQSHKLYQTIYKLLDTKINTKEATYILERGMWEYPIAGFQKFRGTDIDMILSLAYAGTGIEEIRGTGMALYLAILDHAERIRFSKQDSLATRVKKTIPNLEHSRNRLAEIITNHH